MTPIKLDIHGKQKLLPKILAWTSIAGWLSGGLLVVDQKTQFDLVPMLGLICVFFFWLVL